jgi:hypothetical protein
MSRSRVRRMHMPRTTSRSTVVRNLPQQNCGCCSVLNTRIVFIFAGPKEGLMGKAPDPFRHQDSAIALRFSTRLSHHSSSARTASCSAPTWLDLQYQRRRVGTQRAEHSANATAVVLNQPDNRESQWSRSRPAPDRQRRTFSRDSILALFLSNVPFLSEYRCTSCDVHRAAPHRYYFILCPARSVWATASGFSSSAETR